MLFVGDGAAFPNMDGAATAAPLEGTLVDLGLLLLLALLHRSLSRGMLRDFVQRSMPRRLERSTQAWAAAAALALIFVGWQPLPQVLWNATGPMRWALSGLFYVAWTLILIGAFLASHLELFEIGGAADAAPPPTVDVGHARVAEKVPLTGTLPQPLYCGILVAVWATTVMTVGHLLFAAAVTAHLALDGLWAARKAGAAQERRRTFSFQD